MAASSSSAAAAPAPVLHTPGNAHQKVGEKRKGSDLIDSRPTKRIKLIAKEILIG